MNSNNRMIFSTWAGSTAGVAAWFCLETWVEMAWGTPERGLLDPFFLVSWILGLGLAVSLIQFLGLRVACRRPWGLEPSSVAGWWTTGASIGLLVALRGFRAGANAGGDLIGWAVVGCVAVLLVVAMVVVPLLAVRVARRRQGSQPEPLLVAWTAILLLVTPVVLKLEFHHALQADAVAVRSAIACIILTGCVAAVGVSRWNPLSIPSPRIRLAVAVVLLAGSAWLEGIQARTSFSRIAGTSDARAILIVVDTLRADRLGCYGGDGARTPNIDRLADDGTVFERAMATAPWTLPSVATLLTGLEPGQHGAGLNTGQRNLFNPLPDGVPTLAEACRDRGVRTAALVTNPCLHPAFGVERGFDRYQCALGPLGARLPIEILAPALGFRLRPYASATEVTDRALHFVDHVGDGGFLLVLHYMDPHEPYLMPVDGVDGDPGRSSDGALGMRYYDAEINYLDSQLGRLFDGLRSRDVYDGLHVVLTSDHGESFGQRRVISDEGAGPWDRPYGHGQHLYDELLRVPLLVKPGGPRRSSHRRDDLVSLVDVAPTLLDLLGLDPEALDGPGRSLVGDVVADSVSNGAPARFALSESMLIGNESKSITDGHFKLIVRGRPGGEAQRELYDLLADPNECRNLLDSVPGVVSDLDAALAGRLASRDASGAGTDSRVPEGLRSQLGALGYLR